MSVRCRVCDTESQEGVDCSFCSTPLVSPPVFTGALPPGTRLQNGTYSVGRVLGVGGFGLTYLAVDLRLHRLVAIKEFFPFGSLREGNAVHHGSDMSAAVFAAARHRLLHEARVAASFQHPGIVQIFTFFDENETGYIVMELLRGRTLYEVVETGGPMAEQRAIACVGQLASALQAVHQAGFVHRDLKPDNVFLADEGRVVLLDFGTAKELFPGRKPVTAMVSPGYAPPEQYSAAYRPDPRSDVYALAATLYYLLTGMMPVEAPVRMAGTELPGSAALNPQVSPQVSEAIAEGMALDPAQRPATIEMFVDRLRTLPPAAAASATGLPPAPAVDVAASSSGPVGQPAPPIPALVSAAGSAFVPPSGRTSSSTPDDRAFPQPARASSREPDGPFPASRMPDLAALVPSTAGAGGTSPEAPRPGLPPPVGSSSRAGMPPPILREVALMRGHTAIVRAVDFTPDGEWLLSGSEDKTTRLWGVRSHEEHGRLGDHDGWVSCVNVSGDGRRVATASHDKTVRVWNLETRAPIRSLKGSGGALSAVFSPDGDHLAGSFVEGAVVLWDSDGREVARTPPLKQSIWSIAFSPDGSLLAFGTWTDACLHLWDVHRWREADRIAADCGGVRNLVWGPDGALIATATKESAIRIWSVATRSEAMRLEGHRGAVSAVAFHPSGRYLASAGADKTIRLWDLASGRCAQMLETHTGEVVAITFSRNGRYLASGSQDERVGLFSAAS